MSYLYLKQLPNAITIIRIVGVIIILWITPYYNQFWQLLVIYIYTFICLTDFLDGWVARRFNMISYIGKILDPLADKILVLVFLPLLQMQVISSFPVFIILVREFSVMALRIVSAKQQLNLTAARFSGKLKTAITLPICGILLARVPTLPDPQLPFIFQPVAWLQQWVWSWPPHIITGLIYIMVIVTVLSFFDYLYKFLWHSLLQRYKGNIPKAKRIIIVAIPNTFTLLNVLFGLLAVITALNGMYALVVTTILAATVCDALDGLLARKLGVSSRLGERLDSKADVLSFGIAPAIVIYHYLSLTQPLLLCIGSAIIYFSAVFYRLKRFKRSGHSDFFSGVPSPVGAGIIVLAQQSQLTPTPFSFITVVIMISLLMISTIPYMHFRRARHHGFLKYIGRLLLLFFIVTIILAFPITIPYKIIVYDCLLCLLFVYLISPLFVNRNT